MNYLIFYIMSLSKKNLDKLNNLIKDENLIHENNIDNHKNREIEHKNSKNQPRTEDPNKIFYSLIDNSETLNETSQINHFLRKSEENHINSKSRKKHYSKNLTTEDELYDEFNYLLEE